MQFWIIAKRIQSFSQKYLGRERDNVWLIVADFKYYVVMNGKTFHSLFDLNHLFQENVPSTGTNEVSCSYCTLTNDLNRQIMMHECNDCIHDLNSFKSQFLVIILNSIMQILHLTTLWMPLFYILLSRKFSGNDSKQNGVVWKTQVRENLSCKKELIKNKLQKSSWHFCKATIAKADIKNKLTFAFSNEVEYFRNNWVSSKKNNNEREN